jgi:hypothetical protein
MEAPCIFPFGYNKKEYNRILQLRKWFCFLLLGIIGGVAGF